MKRLVLVATLALTACSGGPGAPPQPTRTATPGPVITEAPTDPPVIETGIVSFGLDYDPNSLDIVKPTARFKRTIKEIAWSASFSEPAGATTITLTIASVSAGGAEGVIESLDVKISNPRSDLLANKADLASLVGNKVGTYVLRYSRDGTVLAEGQFTLVK